MKESVKSDTLRRVRAVPHVETPSTNAQEYHSDLNVRVKEDRRDSKRKTT